MYRRGGGRSCAVFGCTNSQKKLSIWRRETCELHSPLLHNGCPCLEPFSFYNFPRDKDKRRAWLEAVGKKSDYNASKSSVVCSIHFLYGSPTSEHPIPLLNMKRQARKSSKTVPSDNGDGSNGDAADTSAVKGILPNLKRKRAYKIMLEEEAILGETLEGSSQSEKRKLDIEGRYPQGSWEQATVEAIMNLRTFDTTTTTSQIAQTIIANLKDENDFLRAQNIKLQWELKSMQEKHSADLQATKEELLALKHRCTCTDEHSKTLPAVTIVPEAEVVEAIEIVHTGISELKSETGRPYSVGLLPAEQSEVRTLLIVDHAAPSEIMCTGANTKTQGNSESEV